MKIIKFYSETCGPCKVLDKNLKEAKINYISINVNDDENSQLLEEYSIKNIPTLIIVDDSGKVVDRHTGLMKPLELKDWCNR